MGILDNRRERRARLDAHETLATTCTQLKQVVFEPYARVMERWSAAVADEWDISYVEDEVNALKAARVEAYSAVLDNRLYVAVVAREHEGAGHEALMLRLTTERDTLGEWLDKQQLGDVTEAKLEYSRLKSQAGMAARVYRIRRDALEDVSWKPRRDQLAEELAEAMDFQERADRAKARLDKLVEDLATYHQQHTRHDQLVRQCSQVALYPSVFAEDTGMRLFVDMNDTAVEHLLTMKRLVDEANEAFDVLKNRVDDQQQLQALDQSGEALAAIFAQARGVSEE